MWRRTALGSKNIFRRRFTAAAPQRYYEDEGDWAYSSEWWGGATDTNESSPRGHNVFRSVSDKGNGIVSVYAFPSSRPEVFYWPETEKWLQKRFAEIHPDSRHQERFRILGYQWRSLHFNDITRQSTVKVMVGYQESRPELPFLMQQGHCLAVPYLKSMVSVGLASIAACNYDIASAVYGKKPMKILCIGHGGGSLPLFLASQIEGATIDIIEIDPVVINASVEAMGFPPYSVVNQTVERSLLEPRSLNQVLWKGIDKRLSLYESDAENFIHDTTKQYDIVFIDAYDGYDIFPRRLWDQNSPFLEALGNHLHPEHGTVVVNLHSEVDFLNSDRSVASILQPILPMGKYVSSVCQAYKNMLVKNGGAPALGFTVSVPWVCNTSLVVCPAFVVPKFGRSDRDLILETLISKSHDVERILDLPFSCLQYMKRGFNLVD